MKKIIKTEEEWKKILSKNEYIITRKKGTEPPFSGKKFDQNKKGLFKCVCCSEVLFDSESKYESNSGWPSFFKSYNTNAISEIQDNSHGMQRTEIICSSCDSHLGHIFDDGPKPTGKRYCVNSYSLTFEEVE